jgi:large subunit ribosomal protein L3
MSLSNSLGLLGRKVGMMRLFTDDGDAVPVTVVDVSNNRVTQVKTQENDGYVALQVTFGSRKASRVTKPQAGHLAKAGVEAGEIIQEFRVTADTAAQYKAGAAVPVTAVFAVGQKVDVQGTTIGKGFTRHDQASPISVRSALRTATAVPTMSRAPSRMAQDPGRVCSPASGCLAILATTLVTTQNLDVIRIDEARQLLLIRGRRAGLQGRFLSPCVPGREGPPAG